MDPARAWDSRIARMLLTPLSWPFAAGVAARNALFDAGVLASRATAVPAISVGNLSVGGTGKTPVSADIARRLRHAGARPAVVLRGYGDDEPAVHALLNPDVPVLTSADRVAGSAAARERGCDVVVLDDAFQHRRAARAVDVVLVATEQWGDRLGLLPAGPYREPASSLRRASLVVVTRKSATEGAAIDVERDVARAGGVPTARVALTPDALRQASPVSAPGAATMPLERLRGARVMAVAAIGNPRAFGVQLEALGARVELVSFPDHHRYTDRDIAHIVARAGRASFVVCTLKDAVKLGGRWPPAMAPLWYVSQRLTLEGGEDAYDACVRRVLAARVSPD